MDAMGTMRDLDQIQERDDSGRSSRLMSLALGGIATACVLFAVGVMVGRESGEARAASREDPLGRLDQLARQGDTAPPMTYAARLTGPTGSLVAPSAAPSVAAGTPGALPGVAPSGAPSDAPSMLDPHNRPLVLGAPTMGALGQGTMVVRPSDPNQLGALNAPGGLRPPAAAGSDGAFTVQVSSFRSLATAQAFSQRLRDRGHRAYVTAPAAGPNNIVWHRVRIGPFTSQREANAYRVDFERRERMPSIIIRRDNATPDRE